MLGDLLVAMGESALILTVAYAPVSLRNIDDVIALRTGRYRYPLPDPEPATRSWLKEYYFAIAHTARWVFIVLWFLMRIVSGLILPAFVDETALFQIVMVTGYSALSFALFIHYRCCLPQNPGQVLIWEDDVRAESMKHSART
ncbi:Uncharacterised protein [Arcanobacterium haemolyticum]|uniref:hypothetical protein n=1 Tax=Arcanobacterium haemolyticum TaxID=28264 RepID=UPI000D98BC6E|nr:hypothetical protein [Arcanobacterium haemolyticum]SPT75652.1 Uncharacterised protein [Arcanobacterium haemolyticum]